MTRIALAVFVSIALAGTSFGADSTGYRKAYFGATKQGAWAQYTMKTEGQADVGYVTTRLADEGGQQRVQTRIEYIVSGATTTASTNYVLKPGYSLESDALGFGKALVGMSSSMPGTKPNVMPAAVVESARKSMPDYAASARFIGTDNIGGKLSEHYSYTQKHPGNPAHIEAGEIWLNDSVPFGLVKQKAVTTEESGKVVSRMEMLLMDSGTASVGDKSADATKPAKGSASGNVSLADAFKGGRVELAVTVVGGSGDGRSLRVGFKNKGDDMLHLTIPAGATTLDVGSPVDKLRLQSGAAKSLDIAPGATSPAMELAQTGSRRAIEGTFAVNVYEGTPLFSGSVTMGTVKP
jgi:hypothetical protein